MDAFKAARPYLINRKLQCGRTRVKRHGECLGLRGSADDGETQRDRGNFREHAWPIGSVAVRTAWSTRGVLTSFLTPSPSRFPFFAHRRVFASTPDHARMSISPSIRRPRCRCDRSGRRSSAHRTRRPKSSLRCLPVNLKQILTISSIVLHRNARCIVSPSRELVM